MTIFERIAAREIPAEIVYEETDFLAFRDIEPKAPVHVLIVPKRAIARVSETGIDDVPLLGRMLVAAGKIAASLGIAGSGFRIVINNGPDGGESVPHLHIHLLGGRSMAWPPG